MDIINIKTIGKINNSEEICNCIEAAIDISNVDGFLNPFGFSCALSLYILEFFYPDMKDKIESDMKDGFFKVFDKYSSNGSLDKMMEEHGEEVKEIEYIASIWYDRYQNFIASGRGILNSLSLLSNDSINELVNKIKEVSETSGVKEVMDMAKSWGINNSDMEIA